MKKLVFTTLLLGGLSLGAGCEVSTHVGTATGAFMVSWTLNGATCDAIGVTNVRVISTRTDDGSVLDDDFPCGDGAGVTKPLALGDYTVSLELEDAGGTVWAVAAPSATAIDLEDEQVTVTFGIDFGTFAANWDIDGNNAGACASVGSIDAQLVAKNRDTEIVYADLFNCVAGTGTAPPVQLGTYDVILNIIDGDGTVKVTTSTTEASLTSASQTVAISWNDMVSDAAFFGLTWTLVDDATNAALTCAEVGADTVSVLTTFVSNGGTGVDDLFDCTDGSAITPEMALGEYTIIVSVRKDSQDLGESMPRTEFLRIGNEVVDLGNFEFAFE